MEIVVYVALILIGACLGSFAGATVWRLRARQLEYDKKHHHHVDTKEYNKLQPLVNTSLHSDRSRCLQCDYKLRWYDLIPVISWLTLRGKCRQCHKPIGLFELLIEVGMIAFFVGSYLLWPFALDSGLEITRFIIWLAAGVVLGMLFSYDAKWYLLPNRLVSTLGVLGIATVVIAAIQSGNPIGTLLSTLISVGVLGGLYLALYLISKGKWVGFGDVKLGAALALFLIDWQLALIALFLANAIGTLIVLPLLVRGTLKRTSRVPFGPLLIVGMIAAQFLGPSILSLYVGVLI